MADAMYAVVTFRFPKGMKPPWLGKRAPGGGNHYEMSPRGMGRPSVDGVTVGAGPFKGAISCIACYGDQANENAILVDSLHTAVAAYKTGNP